MDTSNCKKLWSKIYALLTSTIQTVRLVCSPKKRKPQNEQNPISQKCLSILNRGFQLVKRCEKTSPLNNFQNLRYASEIHQLEKKISDIVQYEIPAQLSLELKKLISEFKSLRHLYELEAVDQRVVNETIVPKLTNDPEENAKMLQQIGKGGMCDEAFDEAPACDCNGSGMSDFIVGGLDKNIVNLKRILLEREVSVVGIQGTGGVGKTTTALALCSDQEIKGAFLNNIIFITVSRSPNLKGILETMWEKIVRRKKPEFQNVEDAHRQLQQELLGQVRRTPHLVVLDDVWSEANLESLLFECEGYKTLVTTRYHSTILTTTSTRLYELPVLDDADALPLFCFWAFGRKSIPSNADERLVKQVQAECKGLPLALKVIGSSLHGQPHPAWESTRNKLVLKVIGSSLHGQTHPAWESTRNKLLNWESISKDGLLGFLETSLPGKWELLKDQAFNAQIVSIHTGAMEDDQWSEMNFPQAEALVLLFSASKYFLPSFLSSMRNLKVLIVFNYGSKRATVNGLSTLSSLTQLKTIHLERLNLPPVQEQRKVLQNLEKLSLSLCEGFGNVSKFNSSQSSLKLLIMLDLNLDHCCDLEEFPSGICDTFSVENWSFTSWHLLQKLPDDSGKLGSLRMLRVSASLSLKRVSSIYWKTWKPGISGHFTM